MACTRLVQAYKHFLTGEVVYSQPRSPNYFPFRHPCQKCIGCRRSDAYQKTVRVRHESLMHDQSSFLTLTYSPENLPKDGNLSRVDSQLFLKRLRINLSRKFGLKIRVFGCGEYGERFRRPHYHIIVFGFDPPDKELLYEKRGFPLYRSSFIEDAWGLGHVSVGSVTWESSAYCCGYVIKKINGKESFDRYARTDTLDKETGDIQMRPKEFGIFSNRVAIGRDWYEKFSETDLWNKGFLTVDGRKSAPPKYYQRLFKEQFPDRYDEWKASQKVQVESAYHAAAREKNLLISTSRMFRNYENGQFGD